MKILHAGLKIAAGLAVTATTLIATALPAGATTGIGMSNWGHPSTTYTVSRGTTQSFYFEFWSPGVAETANVSVSGSYASAAQPSIFLPAAPSSGLVASTQPDGGIVRSSRYYVWDVVTVTVPADAPVGTYTDVVSAQVPAQPSAGISTSMGVGMTIKIVVS